LKLKQKNKTNGSSFFKWVQFAGIFTIAIVVLFIILNFVFPINTTIEYAHFITDEQDEVLHVYLTEDEKWRMFTELDEITPTLKKAIIHKEDKYFYSHPGINPFAIVRAIFNNVVKGKRTSGASTISMQVARLLNPKSRTYLNKLVEMFRAIQLEIAYSKNEILQFYLNLVPYGGNIEGVKAASVFYFNKHPGNLSLAEITALSIIPNRPTSLRPGVHNTKIVEERNKWLTRFENDALFSQKTIADALDEPFNAFRHKAPRIAPHLSRKIKNENLNQPNLKSTININQQLMVEEMVQNYSNRIKSYNINNAAVVVVENKSMQVKAYAGSNNFFDNKNAGQVDGVGAIRSPGSTLKPMVYALAFDEGLISPQSTITDVPVYYSGYSPTNYDDKYNGLVTIEEALAKSLNVPAVKVLNEIGTSQLVNKLSAIGFNQVNKDKNKLGLALALGGCGVSLQNLVELYASFANEGIYAPMRYLVEDTLNLNQTLVSPSAAFIITDILSKLKRPDYPTRSEYIKNAPSIAWKTGTSYGRKDAWSIGYNKDYTIGVWLGNFNSQGVPELTGAEMATPLLFELFKAFGADNSKWYAAPDELKYRWVCSETGLQPSAKCENQILDFHLPLVTNNKTCSHLKAITTNVTKTVSYCPLCVNDTNHSVEYWMEDYPPELVTYYESNKIPYEKIPPHNPNCERIIDDANISIVSPQADIEYLINAVDNDAMMLQCNTANDVAEVFWYVNDEFYEASASDQVVFFTPKAGKSKITCVDDKGRKESVEIKVAYL